jgi:tetratricopeptide (TPR) repeat protein
VIGEEKLLFEKEITSDKEFHQTLELTQEVDTIIRDTELVNFVNTIDEIIANNLNKKERSSSVINPGNKNNFFLRRKFLIAASISLFIVISSLLYFTNSTSNEKLYSQFYYKYDACIVTRGNNNTDALIVAIQLYDKKQYKEAIVKFNDIIKIDNHNSVAYFFIGVSYMEIHSFEKAIQSLNIVINQKDTAFLEHAEWYLALCYLKTNKTSLAKSLIKQIAASDSYYHSKANNLSRKLK